MGWGSRMGRSQPERGFVLVGPHEKTGNGTPVVRLRKTVVEEGEVVAETECWLAVGDTITTTLRTLLTDEARDVHSETESIVTYEVLGDEP